MLSRAGPGAIMTSAMIAVKRVYEPASRGDGERVLVEGLWPRGIKKQDLQMDDWIKAVAPSTELRKWFGHEPAKWAEFQRRYAAELEAEPDAWAPLLARARRGRLTLLFSSRDEEHNNAVALKAFLDRKLR